MNANIFYLYKTSRKKTAEIVVDKAGKVKEIEIESQNTSEAKELWNEIISKKKK